MAWHALVTGVAVFGLSRASVHWSVITQIFALMGLGLLGAYFAPYWLFERGTMPDIWSVMFYLVGLGLAVLIGNMVLDRLASIHRLDAFTMLIAPGILATVWGIQTYASFSLYRLTVSFLLGLTYWMMRRLGTDIPVINFGAPT